MHASATTDRRAFLKTSLLGGLAAFAAPCLPGLVLAAEEKGVKPASRVALTAGDDRADITFRGLKAFEKEIVRAIGAW